MEWWERVDHWLEPWPSWSGRWFGITLRVFLLIIVGLFTLLMFALISFAVSGWSSEATWDGESVTFLILTLVVSATGLWEVFRPSRAALIVLCVAVLTSMVIGAQI